MAFLIFLLALVFCFYFLFPRLIPWLLRRYVNRNAARFSDQFARANGLDPEELRRRKQEEDVRRKGGWSHPAPRRKKIDPSTGEYIRFTEIETTTSTSTQTSDDGRSQTTTYESEQQITDIRWTDLPGGE